MTVLSFPGYHSLTRLLRVALPAGLIVILLVLLVPAVARGVSPPAFDSLNVTSNNDTYFYSDTLPPTGGTVFFNNLTGQGEGQELSVTVTSADATANLFEGGEAFGMTPTPDTSPDVLGGWTVTYVVDDSPQSWPGVVFTLTNQVGLSSTTTVSFERDVTPPALSAPAVVDFTNSIHLDAAGTALTYGGNIQDPQDFRVEGTAADQPDGAGLKDVDFSTAFGDNPAFNFSSPYDTKAPWSGDYDIEQGDTGDGTIAATLSDRVGNTSQQTFSYAQETTPPVVSFTTVPDPDYDTNGNRFDADGSNWYQSSALGAGWIFETDADHPPAELAEGSCLWDHENDGDDQLLACGIGGDGTFNNVHNDADGLVAVTVTLTDTVGNAGSAVVSFHLDGGSPNVGGLTITENSDLLRGAGTTLYYGDIPGLGESFMVMGDASDDAGVGLDQAVFSSAFGTTPDPDTTPAVWDASYMAKNSGGPSGQIDVTVFDLVGNSKTKSFTYVQDTQPPASAVDSGSVDGNKIRLDWTGADSGGSGMQTTVLWYRRNSGGGWTPAPVDPKGGESGTFLFVPAQDGTYYFGTQARDNVDNLEAAPSGSGDQMILFDTTPPTLSSLQLIENSSKLYYDESTNTLYYDDSFSGSAAFTIAGAAEDGPAGEGGLDHITYTDVFDSSSPFTEPLSGYADTWERTYLVRSRDDGDGVLSATVYDAAGNSTAATFNYVEDFQAPSSSIDDAQLVGNQFRLPWSASDDSGSGVQSTELWYRRNSDGSWAAASVGSQDGNSGNFFFTPNQDGSYYFASRATDNLGKREAAPSGDGDQRIIYDTVPPVISSKELVETSDYLHWDGGVLYYSDAIPGSATFTISGEATDDPASEAELAQVEFSDVFDSTPPFTDPLSGYVATWNRTYSVNSSHTGTGVILARVWDGGGNSAPASFTYTRDEAAPAPPSISVAANQSEGTSFEVAWSTSDPSSSAGIRGYRVEYRVDQGPWKVWFTDTPDTSATFGPTAPEQVDRAKTYQFRVRATDNVGHVGQFGTSSVFSPPLVLISMPLVLNSFGTPSLWDIYFEDNDDQDQAYGPLVSGLDYRAFPDDVEDFYFLELSSTGDISIFLTNFIVGEGDLLLYRVNNSLNPPREFVANVGFYSPSMTLTVTAQAPGTYLVRVRTTAGSSTNNLYNLKVIH
jgi:hypothetical protein